MSFTLTYDDDLSRVQLEARDLGVMNSNTYFESTVLPWVAFGGAIARVTTPVYEGAGALRLTPDGVSATARTECEQSTGVSVGTSYGARARVRVPIARGVGIGINWFDASGTYLSTAAVGGFYALAANTWTEIAVQGVAPASAAKASISINLDGTPPISNLLYIDSAKLYYDPAVPTAPGVLIERSTNGVQWTTVRGASSIPPSGVYQIAQADDYEFTPGVLNTYRAKLLSPVGVVLFTHTNSITPSIDGVWLKSVARPYLNRKVTVKEYSNVSRKSRAGVFNVSGRTMPVVVSDVASGRSWTLDVLTRSLDESHALDLLLASGDILHVQAPPDCDVPAGYVSVGDTDLSRVSRPLRDNRRIFGIPMTECARPGPDIVGSTSTWAGLLAAYGSWTAVLAAFPTWQDVLDYVAAADTVIVP